MRDHYTLPAGLGGGEVLITGPDDPQGMVPVVHVATDFALKVHRSLLTPVKPPLPQPAVGGVVLDKHGTAWQRHSTGPVGGVVLDRQWWAAADRPDRSWEQLNELGPLTVLVPDPFAEPVDLPWRQTSYGPPRVLVFEHLDEVAVSFGETAIAKHFAPNEAREFARALWAAANQVEGNQT